MPATPAESAEHDEPWSQVLVACLEAIDSGQALDRVALLVRYPQFAAELSRFLEDQEQVERLASPLREALRAADTPRATGATVAEVGDASAARVREAGNSEVLEEIGRSPRKN